MKMIRRFGMARRLLMAALLMAAVAVPAGATTLRRMDLGEMIGLADRVVHARVVSQDVHWNESGTQILTDTQFDVIDEAKGRGPGRLTVSLLGGALGIVEMRQEGTPVFAPGEEVVLFIAPGPEKKALVGFSQGVLRVTEDAATGRKLVTSEVPAGVVYMEGTGAAMRPVRPARQRANLTDLMEHVRKVARGDAPAGPAIEATPRRLKPAGSAAGEVKP